MRTLESGECGCGNRMFMQMTVVVFADAPVVFADASGRKKQRSERVLKAYECLACGARYVHNTRDDRFVSA